MLSNHRLYGHSKLILGQMLGRCTMSGGPCGQEAAAHGREGEPLDGLRGHRRRRRAAV